MTKVSENAISGPAFHESILNCAAEAVWVVDLQGQTTFVNQAAANLCGWEAAELLGSFQHDILRHANAKGAPVDAAACRLCRAFETGIRQRVTDAVFARKDKTTFPVEYESAPFFEQGALAGAVLTFRNVTEHHKVQSALVHAQKLESIGQLAAGIAHEINTPTQFVGDNTRFLKDAFHSLNSLVSVAERLIEAAKQGDVSADLVEEATAAARAADIAYLIDEVPKAIDQSLEGIDRVAKIVRAMKEFSHPDSDGKVPTDLNKAIEGTATVARNEWKYVAEMVLDLDPALPLVSCLAGELNQVILNLVVNAAHAITDVLGQGPVRKGTISISTRREGDHVAIRVRDTGAGIPPAIRSKIFDPFFTTKPVGRGTGQGLAIAYAVIVEKHGGKISFETEIGKGTTFIIHLPLDAEPSSWSGEERESANYAG
jgi:PAS domain S-box-containing protein